MADTAFQEQVTSASQLASELRTAFRVLKLRLRAQGGDSDLTPSQSAVVLRLEKDGPTTVSGLARAEGMRPQSMSAAVNPLLESGLLKGSPDPNDGRQTLLSLTPKCAKWLRESRAARQDWLTTKIDEKLSAPEQTKLRAALALLTRIVE